MPTIRPACTGSASSAAPKNSVSGFSIRISPRAEATGVPKSAAWEPSSAFTKDGYRLCQTTRTAPVPSSAAASMRSMPRRIRTARTPWKRTRIVAGLPHSSPATDAKRLRSS